MGYLVSLSYPARYPYQEPKLRVEQPRLREGAPHTYADASLCVHRASWDPNRSTAVSEVPLIAAWLVAYENWLSTGERF
jgi:ubiquitin-protein ligase